MAHLLGKRGKKLGKLLLCAYFGLYGRRKRGECLKILKKYISQPNNPLCIIF